MNEPYVADGYVEAGYVVSTGLGGAYMATAGDVLNRAREILGDKSSIRFPDAKLLYWLNDALDLLLKANDRLFMRRGTHVAAAGAAQKLILTRGVRLVGVIGATRCDREPLDRFSPGWEEGATGAIVNWMHGDEGPLSFLTYPPQAAATQLSVNYVQAPDEIGDAGTALPVTNDYVGPLADYVVGMAKTKETEQESIQRSQVFFQAFGAKLGLKPPVQPRSAEPAPKE